MPPHAHGGGEEEEVVIIPTNGPPFVDLHSSPDVGFESDYHKVERWLGPGKVRGCSHCLRAPLPAAPPLPAHARQLPAAPPLTPPPTSQISRTDFERDIAAINAAYIPTVSAANWYLQRGTIIMLGAFGAFIIMGMVGGTPEARGVVNPLCLLAFLVGVGFLVYSRFREQPGIRQGALLVKALLDNGIQANYAKSEYSLRWTIRVNVQKRQALHMGKVFVERPIISIYALTSPNDQGVMLNWPLPEALLGGLLFEHTAHGPRRQIEDQEGW